MITYFYWALIIAVAVGLLFVFDKADQWKAGFISTLTVMLIGWAAYFFHFEQIFVKRFGGVMSVAVKEGQMHLGATWKGDNLWIENYDPASNTCHFYEYSRGNLLQGQVTIKHCNPLLPNASAHPQAALLKPASSKTSQSQ